MNEQNKYREETEFAAGAVEQAFRHIGRQNAPSRFQVEQKGSFDLVTDLDKQIEQELTAAIRRRFDGDAVLGEEFTSAEPIRRRTWTIDPIDGTCNLANGIPQYGIQMSLIENNEVVCTAIRTCAGELFTAAKGGGAWLNGQRLVSRPRSLNSCIASFGDFPHSSRENSDLTLRAISRLKDHIMKIRLFGAACLDYCYLAAGRTDLVFMYSRNLWDICPGLLLCLEAGCGAYAMDGGPYRMDGPGIIVTNNQELLQLLL